MNKAREKTYRLFDSHEFVHELLHVFVLSSHGFGSWNLLVIVPSGQSPQNLFYRQFLGWVVRCLKLRRTVVLFQAGVGKWLFGFDATVASLSFCCAHVARSRRLARE